MKRVELERLGLISASNISSKAIMLAAELSRAVERSLGERIVLSDNQAISLLIDQVTQIGDPSLDALLGTFIEELISSSDGSQAESVCARSESGRIYLDSVNSQLI